MLIFDRRAKAESLWSAEASNIAMRILILSAAVGAGHGRAAKRIADFNCIVATLL